MNIKILLVTASLIFLSTNTVSESKIYNEESLIKGVRDGKSAQITEENEFKDNNSFSRENSVTQNMMQGAAMQSQSRIGNIDIQGVTVVDSRGESIGYVDKVVAKDSKKMVVIGLNDSLKEVAVLMSDLTWENENLAVNVSRNELESQEDVDVSYYVILEPGEYNIYESARFEKAESEK